MRNTTQAIKRLSITNSISPDQIICICNKSNNGYYLLDSVHRDLYELNGNILSQSQLDPQVLEDTFSQGLFGETDSLIEELYGKKCGSVLDLFRNSNDKMSLRMSSDQ